MLNPLVDQFDQMRKGMLGGLTPFQPPEPEPIQFGGNLPGPGPGIAMPGSGASRGPAPGPAPSGGGVAGRFAALDQTFGDASGRPRVTGTPSTTAASAVCRTRGTQRRTSTATSGLATTSGTRGPCRRALPTPGRMARKRSSSTTSDRASTSMSPGRDALREWSRRRGAFLYFDRCGQGHSGPVDDGWNGALHDKPHHRLVRFQVRHSWHWSVLLCRLFGRG